MKVKVKFAGEIRTVEVTDKECPSRKCFHPHNCPVRSGGGVGNGYSYDSKPRWLCLTNYLNGCPADKNIMGGEK
jgi:hypothetical protein